jgi:hypothetical protein
MEVIGILSAIPGLVDLVTRTTKLVQACASKTSLAKTTKGLDVQLNLLGEVLAGIDKRWKARTLSPDQLTWLGPVVKELREELASLNSLLAKASIPNCELGFVGRAKLALGGFETQVKTHPANREHQDASDIQNCRRYSRGNLGYESAYSCAPLRHVVRLEIGLILISRCG